MTLKLCIVKETTADEKRVAASPESVKKLTALGFDVHVEKGAGTAASLTDSAFREAGATIAENLAKALADAEVILSVRGLDADSLDGVKAGALMLGLLNPFGEKPGSKPMPRLESGPWLWNWCPASPGRNPWMFCRRRPIWQAIKRFWKGRAFSPALFP
ncbi:hypothetical protein JCM17846_14470 [Iodidimonas nitroreducens]|uniref:proton-translocating NAD(P)(+) transhydrogenase n=1 Tax=Iodidimonas nitroreducens TaxID=1236968 RepID=A0A5A7N800_9PROT|nr:hypothetical protein JCM17846_14470 [Iodidimonas nitroreducens]